MSESEALWDGNIFGGVLLVLTNLALVPSVMLLAERGDATSGLVLLLTFFASVLYHSCRAGFVCLAQYELHVLVDYLFVYVGAIWVVASLPFEILKSAGDAQMHAFFFFLFLGPMVLAIVSEVMFSLLPVIGVALPFVSVLIYARLLAFPRRKLFRKGALPLLLTAAAFLVLAGVCMFVLQNGIYAIAHSLWHVLSMAGVFFLLLARRY